MRKVIYSQMVTLDGFIEGANGEIDWGVPDAEVFQFINDQERMVDTHLYGRKTYENMADYWPGMDTNPSASDFEIEFSRNWKKISKIVFSKTMEKVEWNSTLVRDQITEEMTRLKSEPGKNLLLGGAGLAATFMKQGLIDEYQLYIHPIILGGGKPLIPVLDNPINLHLIESRKFDSGVMYLRYQVAGGEQT